MTPNFTWIYSVKLPYFEENVSRTADILEIFTKSTPFIVFPSLCYQEAKFHLTRTIICRVNLFGHVDY